MMLLLSVCGYLGLYPKSATEKSMSFYISWYKIHIYTKIHNIHILPYGLVTAQKEDLMKTFFKRKSVFTSTADSVGDSSAVSRSPIFSCMKNTKLD